MRLSPEQLKTHIDRMAKSLPVRKVRKLDANKSWVKPKARSKGEEGLEMALEGLEMALQGANAPPWVSEYRFDPKRRYRADFAFLEARLLVEVEQ